jgi:hypothetical protein
MFEETSISLLVGGAAFVGAEFLSCWNSTFTLGMGALLLRHDCLLDGKGLWYVSIIGLHPLLLNQAIRSFTPASFRLSPVRRPYSWKWLFPGAHRNAPRQKQHVSMLKEVGAKRGNASRLSTELEKRGGFWSCPSPVVQGSESMCVMT